MPKEKDKRLSDSDRKLGVVINRCQECDFEFFTLKRDNIYCAFCCSFKGFKNPERKVKRRR